MLTERTIQIAIFRLLRSKTAVALPNFTPSGWWECDLWAVTKSGYAHEYEIKLTTSDFRADAAKRSGPRWRYRNGLWENLGTVSKHEQLRDAPDKGPSFFWFVAPAGLLALEDIPDWAGLIEAGEKDGWVWPTLRAAKEAPRRHRIKVTDKAMAAAQRVCYWRFWNEAENVQRMIRDRADAQRMLAEGDVR